MANNKRHAPTESRARRPHPPLRRWLGALRSNRRGVITTEYIVAVAVCAVALIATYRGFNHALTSEVRTRVGLLSTGGAPQATDPLGNRPPPLGPQRPPSPTQPGPPARPGAPQVPPRCTGDTCSRPGLEERGTRPAPDTRRRAPYEQARRAERDARHARGERPTPWKDAREKHWKETAAREEAAQRQDPNYRPRYSQQNLARMHLGLAPQIRVELEDRHGNRRVCDLPIELHHTLIPQRSGTDLAHEPWNLTPVPGWAHDAMDPYRHFGFELVRIAHGPTTWNGRQRRSCFGS